MARWGFAPFAVSAYDNPETIRMRKYVTGAHFVLRGPGSRRDELQRKSFGRRARPGSTGTDAEKRLAVPVLLVYALILRPYVLDLVPGNSLVGYLVGEGFDVYLLDWGVPDGQDSDLSFEDYVLDYMAGGGEGGCPNPQARVNHPLFVRGG